VGVAYWSDRTWSVIALSNFFALSLVCLRQILLTPGTVGHHWDWSLPSSSISYESMLSQSLQVWNLQFLGHPYGYGISVLPIMALVGVLGSSGLSGEFLSKTLLLSVITFSGFTSYQLLLQLTGTSHFTSVAAESRTVIHVGSMLGGCFYALSPFLYNEIVGGAFTQIVAYALAPLGILAFILAHAHASRNWKNVIVAALTLSAVAMSLQYLVLVVAVLIIISLPTFRTGMKTLGKILLLWFPLNLYWILPLSYSLQWTLGEATSQNSSASILENFHVHVPNLIQAFVGTGYWTDFFTSTIPSWFLPVWLIASLSLVSSALIFLVSTKIVSSVIPWVALLISSIVFETGSNSPLSGAIEWLIVNVPPMVLFKSPQHLIFPTTLALSVLVGIFAVSSTRVLSTARKVGIFLVLLVLVSVWVSPFFYGNLGGYVDVYRLPPSYQEINKIIASDPEPGFRVMYLPAAGSPQYLADRFQSNNQGGDPMVIYSPAPTLTSDLAPNQQTRDLASGIEELLAEQSAPTNASKMLAFLNVKYVIVRYDVIPNFGPLAGHWNGSLVTWNLQHMDGLKLLASFPQAELWAVKMQSTPLVYAATNIIFDDVPILGIKNWQALAGQWSAYGMQSVNGTAGILRTNNIYHNFELEVETKLTQQSSLDNWVLWRGIDANNFYYAGQTGVGYFTVGRVEGGQRTELYSSWMTYSRGQPVWVRVLASSTSSQVYSGNGTSWTLQYILNDSAFQTGFVGLHPTEGGQFGNITVNDSQGNLLYKDNFDDSNLIQLIISPRFVIGHTVVVSPVGAKSAHVPSNAFAQAVATGPSRFEVTVNSSNPFYLVYSQTFDPGWTLALAGATHILGNGYANVWEIDSPGTHDVSLSFQPQVLFEYGSIIALVTIPASLVLMTNAQNVLKSIVRRTRRRTVGLIHP